MSRNLRDLQKHGLLATWLDLAHLPDVLAEAAAARVGRAYTRTPEDLLDELDELDELLERTEQEEAP